MISSKALLGRRQQQSVRPSSTHRISVLDSFRGLAILLVALFHYFSRWTPPHTAVSLYPYGSAYDYFGLGYVGVEFFFIISGFVIFFTMESTVSMGVFWKKRFIRLLPSLAVATLLTYIIFILFDPHRLFPYSHSAKNFIPSLLFVNPELLNRLFPSATPPFAYINGSYWSLWVEVQFYFVASLIFYRRPEKFLRRFLLLSLVAVGFHYVNQRAASQSHWPAVKPFAERWLYWTTWCFDLIVYLPFFCLGILFYRFYKNRIAGKATTNFERTCFFLLVSFLLYTSRGWTLRIANAGMMIVFATFVYRPAWLNFLNKKWLIRTGESSYFFYLIHENTGVLLIYSFGAFFLPYGFAFSLGVIVLLAVASIAYTRRLEQPWSRWLKKKRHKPERKIQLYSQSS